MAIEQGDGPTEGLVNAYMRRGLSREAAEEAATQTLEVAAQSLAETGTVNLVRKEPDGGMTLKVLRLSLEAAEATDQSPAG